MHNANSGFSRYRGAERQCAEHELQQNIVTHPSWKTGSQKFTEKEIAATLC